MRITIAGNKNTEHTVSIRNICMRTKHGRMYFLYLGEPEFEVHGGNAPSWKFEEEATLFLKALDRSPAGYHLVPLSDEYFQDIAESALIGIEAQVKDHPHDPDKVIVINVEELSFITDGYGGEGEQVLTHTRSDGYPVYRICA